MDKTNLRKEQNIWQYEITGLKKPNLDFFLLILNEFPIIVVLPVLDLTDDDEELHIVEVPQKIRAKSKKARTLWV